MLYMIDRRPVIISALYLSIHSVFVDVMFHIYTLCKSHVGCMAESAHHTLWHAYIVLLAFLWYKPVTLRPLDGLVHTLNRLVGIV